MHTTPSLLWTLEEIGQLVSGSGNPSETLTNIVNLIQQRFDTDVCSVYLLEPDRTTLVLAATIGLRPESVGLVKMRVSEGLAGLVAEQLRPVFVQDATQHPRFKYFREAGEDPYKTFLGVPVIDRGVLQGVLVVQTAAARTFPDDMQRMLATAGAQLAPIVSEARAVGQLRHAGAPAALGAGAEPVVDVGRRGGRPVQGAGSPAVARVRPQSDPAASTDADHRARGARLRARAARPDQLRLPAPAGIPALETHVGRAERQRPRRAPGGVLLRGVRPARIPADLLRRARDPGRRPSEERLGSRDSPGRRRAVLRPGLLPPAAGCHRLAARGLPRRRSSRPADAAGGHAGRRAADGGDRHPHRPHPGPGVARECRPQHAAAARLERGRQQPRGSAAHLAPVWRRRAGAHPAGAGARRRRRESAGRARYLTRCAAPQ